MSGDSSPARPSWWRAASTRVTQWREARALARRSIPEPLWQLTLARLPFVARLAEEDRAALRRLCSLFLDQKTFAGAGGIVVTDELALTIAAQACLPILHLGLHCYRGVHGIVVQPDERVVARSYTDDDGIVHEYEDTITGELGHGGLLMLNWADIDDTIEAAGRGYNVVIHEFMHALDETTGAIDGVPPLPDDAARAHWMSVIGAAYETFCAMVDAEADTVVDPYGAEAIDEFFPVAVEAFFVDPVPFKREWPQLHTLFRAYFRQDPAAS